MTAEVRLGRAGVRRGWMFVAAATAVYVAAAAVAIRLGHASFLPTLAYPLLFFVGTLVLLLLRRRDDAVVIGSDHLAVEGRSGSHRWPWSQVLEVGTSKTSAGPLTWTPNLIVLVRPDGRAWASPGPNMPLMVSLPVFGRGARDRAVDALRVACREHGVPFDESGLRMAEQPRPDSPLRKRRKH